MRPTEPAQLLLSCLLVRLLDVLPSTDAHIIEIDLWTWLWDKNPGGTVQADEPEQKGEEEEQQDEAMRDGKVQRSHLFAHVAKGEDGKVDPLYESSEAYELFGRLLNPRDCLYWCFISNGAPVVCSVLDQLLLFITRDLPREFGCRHLGLLSLDHW